MHTICHTRQIPLRSFRSPSAAPACTIASQLAPAGTGTLETPQIFSTPEVLKAGGLPALKIIGAPGSS